jgi:hypothetical protein
MKSAPWLFALSSDQVPAKLAGAAALAARTASPNAVISPAIKNNLLIRKSSVSL